MTDIHPMIELLSQTALSAHHNYTPTGYATDRDSSPSLQAKPSPRHQLHPLATAPFQVTYIRLELLDLTNPNNHTIISFFVHPQRRVVEAPPQRDLDHGQVVLL